MRPYNIQRVWKDREVDLLSRWGRLVAAFYPETMVWKRRGLTFTLTYKENMGNPKEFVRVSVTFVPAPKDAPWERRIEAKITVCSHSDEYFLNEINVALALEGLRYQL